MSLATGISIGPGVCGRGLYIPHHGSIVVNSSARIGRFCTLQSGVNIGATASGVPQLGDYVFVGPGVVVFGAVRIGAAAVLGANAVVSRDVPSGVTVVGVPARIISERNSASVVAPWLREVVAAGIGEAR
ncbi:MAG: serine O-acetyltransferase [Alcaligenaceae bacterium]|nr:MAG: serine O-acetyltransferase [Alcaligenaceae bacterium]